jgi:nitrite reductase/ring-hydroxylating ferredoxin subunit
MGVVSAERVESIADRDRRDRPLSNRTRAERWSVAFPFGWDADELVARRNLLRWAVMASGALFAATGVIAGLSFRLERRRGSRQAVVDAAAVPPGSVHYFAYPTAEDHAILLHLPDAGFVAYSGKCTHLSCAVYWNEARGQLVCPCHEGVFDPRTGEVLAGPPPRPLPQIELSETGGTIYAEAEVLRGI